MKFLADGHPSRSHLIDHAGAGTFKLVGQAPTVDFESFRRLVLNASGELHHYRQQPSGEAAIVIAPRSRRSTTVLLFGLWDAGLVPLLLDHRTPPSRIDTIRALLEPAITLRYVETEPSINLKVLEDNWEVQRYTSGQVVAACPDPAYVATTSGSTGEPLLPLCQWGGLVSVANYWADTARLTSQSRVLQFASPSYDAFYTEVLPVYLSGATLVCLDDEVWASPTRLAARISADKISHLCVPPSYAAQLFATESMPHVEFIGLAGETLDGETAARAREYADRVVNAYGPAEATVCVSTHIIETPEDDIPLGTPAPGIDISIDDGEIVLSGAGVAWTYVGNPPELARFSKDESTGNRSYRTGDLGEIMGGVLYFRGRRDDQLKRSGHRTSLNAIAWGVRRIPGVTDCAVISWRNRPSCLVQTNLTIAEVTASLRATLTVAEWPAYWLKVDSIPHLFSDKLDHAAAVALFEAQISGDSENIEPRWLAELWRRFATLADLQDDFFNAGGDSLGALQLLDDIYTRVNVEVDLDEFVHSPTFAWLCDATAINAIPSTISATDNLRREGL